MAIQIQGFSGIAAEVEAASRAWRVTSRPIDVVGKGSYAIAATSGTIAATTTGVVFAFRWSDASNLALLRAVRLGCSSLIGFAAGLAVYSMTLGRSYSANHTGGTAQTLTGNNQKRRTSFGTSLVADMRMATTAALGGGTITLDAQPVGLVAATVATAANTNFLNLPTTTLWNRDTDGEWPGVFTTNEGFVVQIVSTPATGTLRMDVQVEWTEVPNANY